MEQMSFVAQLMHPIAGFRDQWIKLGRIIPPCNDIWYSAFKKINIFSHLAMHCMCCILGFPLISINGNFAEEIPRWKQCRILSYSFLCITLLLPQKYYMQIVYTAVLIRINDGRKVGGGK